jgi:GrpB-like predicted nucleotidyltransferase (UPF0157 family)
MEAIEVVDYEPRWPADLDALAQRIRACLGELSVTVEHIGSTAVPGLAAKPSIDIDILVSSDRQVMPPIERLAELGYQHEGDLGSADEKHFTAPRGWRAHHLYVVVRGNEPHRNHLRLRDYLRKHPNAARDYADLKRTLAEHHPDDGLPTPRERVRSSLSSSPAASA